MIVEKTQENNNKVEERKAFLIDRRPRRTMSAGWNQFWLLFQKNLILAKRSKIWVIFELLLPCLFTLPIILVVIKFANIEQLPAQRFDSSVISGDRSDLSRNVGFTRRITTRWGNSDLVNIGYTTDIGGSDLEKIMNSFASRFENGPTELKFRKFANRNEMVDELKKDIANINSSFIGNLAFIGKYAAGFEFKELSLTEKKLSYYIHLPNLPSSEGDVFHVNNNWEDPYGPPPMDYNRIPPTPPYWSSAFLTFQYALDSSFISLTTGVKVPEMFLQRLPEYAYKVSSVGTFVKYLPMLWGMCAFLAVLHAGREVAHEKFTVKAFLSVMGLSSPMFYFSHILFSWIKCLIVFLVCAVPLATVMTNISISLFFFTVFLYGLGAIAFGVLIASIFKTPNSVIKMIIITWIPLVAIPYIKTIRTEEVSLCFLSSLNINGAFYFAVAAISDNMYREHPLGWLNMFYGGPYNFTIGYAILMMIFDIIWMIGLTLLCDYVLGSSDFNLRGMFARESVEEADFGEKKTLAEECDAALKASKPNIEIHNLVKVWPETGERAVDGFSLNAYPGGVTVLLGHNGAGKSTTFSILCGLIKSTSGSVKVCDDEVTVGQSHHKVGLCPQGNALFDKLSVDEHLWLIHGLKNGRQNWKDDGFRFKDQLGLTEKSTELSMNLSGGMKRKLCVCLALIGDSQVILLDEPTAGMDPGARKDVEKLLVEEKKKRTILLTTHYMDEAELLGDRVAIMYKGHVACVGTPEFLKKKFGTGYVLTVVVEEETDANSGLKRTNQEDIIKKIVSFAQNYVPNVKEGEVHGRQLELILPKEEQNKFPQFLKDLEKNQKRLKVASFGLSLNTLEQVFLKVGEEANIDHIQEDNEDLNKKLIASQNDAKYDGISLVLAQLRTIFTKRCLYSYRNWPQLATQVLVPLLILGFITWLSNFAISSGGNDYTRSYSRGDFGPSRVILQSDSNSPLSKSYKKIVKSWAGSELIEISPTDNLTAKVISLPKTLPATGLGAYFSDDKVMGFFNRRAPHAIVTTLNLISNTRLTALGNGTGLISTGLFAYSQPASSTRIFTAGIIDNIIGPLLMLALALVTSTFVMFYVDERKSKFAHQQSLTGVSPIVFWGGSVLYDLLFYTLLCGAFLIFFLASKWLYSVLDFVILLWFLYFWAVMPFIYTVSFIFASPSKANVLLVIWQIVAAFAAIIILLVVNLQVNMGNIDHTIAEIVRTCLLMFLPSFALGNGLMTLGIASYIPGSHDSLWEWDQLGKNIACMAIFGLLSFVIFIAFQFKVVRRAFSKIWNISVFPKNDNSVNDEVLDNDVEKERALLTSDENYCRSLLLEVHNLNKNFGKVRAVDHLTMGVHKGECFGLLGVNGAGKTTTFDILTGQSFSTTGYAKIDGHDVTEHIAIGYCPQFDAMMMDFTGKETLTMIARMYGFKNPEKKAKLVLDAVGMEHHGHKLVRYYSGGQRRKLSVGLALLASTKIVILDEPTAGIDPKARRDVWNVLTAVRKNSNSGLLLTSHSMDECEALCTRIAVLKKGRMIAIGEAQRLKSRYGNNFTLTMVLNSIEEIDNVINRVAAEFPESRLKTHSSSNSLTLKWQLPRKDTDLWSTKFAECEKMARSLNVKDFCLTQSSLEETFLRISNDVSS